MPGHRIRPKGVRPARDGDASPDGAAFRNSAPTSPIAPEVAPDMQPGTDAATPDTSVAAAALPSPNENSGAASDILGRAGDLQQPSYTTNVFEPINAPGDAIQGVRCTRQMIQRGVSLVERVLSPTGAVPADNMQNLRQHRRSPVGGGVDLSSPEAPPRRIYFRENRIHADDVWAEGYDSDGEMAPPLEHPDLANEEYDEEALPERSIAPLGTVAWNHISVGFARAEGEVVVDARFLVHPYSPDEYDSLSQAAMRDRGEGKSYFEPLSIL